MNKKNDVKTMLSRFSSEGGLLVSVPCDLVADHDTLHEPLRVESCVIVTHLHCSELAQVLTLRNHSDIKHPNQYLHPICTYGQVLIQFCTFSFPVYTKIKTEKIEQEGKTTNQMRSLHQMSLRDKMK